MPLHVSSTFAHLQEVKIALHSLWYHYTYRWLSETATYRCDDTRGCGMQFWPSDDEHICSKHVEAWNKLIVKQKFCASSWLITEINILRRTVSETSKLVRLFALSIKLFSNVRIQILLKYSMFWNTEVSVSVIRRWNTHLVPSARLTNVCVPVTSWTRLRQKAVSASKSFFANTGTPYGYITSFLAKKTGTRLRK